MKMYNALTIAVIFLALTSACVPRMPSDRAVRPMISEKYGAIVGSIAVPGGINDILLKRYGKPHAPPSTRGAHGHVDDLGNVFFANLGPGTYYMQGFYSGRMFHPLVNNKKEVLNSLITVKAGEITYFGSYVVEYLKTGFFEGAKFTIKPVAEPDEADVLTALGPMLKNRGWDRVVETRLRQLAEKKKPTVPAGSGMNISSRSTTNAVN